MIIRGAAVIFTNSEIRTEAKTVYASSRSMPGRYTWKYKR